MYRYRNKYNAVKTIYNGTYFDSKLEASYAMYLDALKEKGEVVDYKTQVTLPLEVNGKRVCTYRIDFIVTYKNGKEEYVETKGVMTPSARLKIKLLEAITGLRVNVVYKVPNR